MDIWNRPNDLRLNLLCVFLLIAPIPTECPTTQTMGTVNNAANHIYSDATQRQSSITKEKSPVTYRVFGFTKCKPCNQAHLIISFIDQVSKQKITLTRSLAIYRAQSTFEPCEHIKTYINRFPIKIFGSILSCCPYHSAIHMRYGHKPHNAI